MEKLRRFLTTYPVFGFLCLTFLISVISFVLMLLVPGGQSPETATGLPIWLIAIWSPNMAAISIWWAKNEVRVRLQKAFRLPPISWWNVIVFIPLGIAAALLFMEISAGHNIEWANFKWRYVVPLVFINLCLGPLGEELGWRSHLYPILKQKYGWLASAFFVGIIWALWHGPLWFVDSPQSNIPFWAFTVNVVVLSMLMSMMYNHAKGSIVSSVLLHLTFNVSLGVIDILQSHTPANYVISSLFLYVPIALLLVGVHEMNNRFTCPT